MSAIIIMVSLAATDIALNILFVDVVEVAPDAVTERLTVTAAECVLHKTI
jgi:hypothetical protein